MRNYDTVVLPEFLTASMVRRRRQKLNLPPLRDREDVNDTPRAAKFTLHKTTRKGMRWISHYAFRQRLLAKALADPNGKKDVILTTEEYTTKQCPFCDFVNHNIGGSKVFKCGRCGFEGPRDNVGSFGLRSIVKKEVSVEESGEEGDGVDGEPVTPTPKGRGRNGSQSVPTTIETRGDTTPTTSIPAVSAGILASREGTLDDIGGNGIEQGGDELDDGVGGITTITRTQSVTIREDPVCGLTGSWWPPSFGPWGCYVSVLVFFPIPTAQMQMQVLSNGQTSTTATEVLSQTVDAQRTVTAVDAQSTVTAITTRRGDVKSADAKSHLETWSD
ncbi:hypothetical protein HK104_002124 [Borealophlyctis nickersoniae]|nr:hypothetical protein HK104_002124 [Borealophlyctis nickersoniae]